MGSAFIRGICGEFGVGRFFFAPFARFLRIKDMRDRFA
jgi:hypothetical protein